jgi:CRP-like cAMP-binding protein
LCTTILLYIVPVKYAQYYYIVKLLNVFIVCLHWNACMFAYLSFGNLTEQEFVEMNTSFGREFGTSVNIGAMYAESLYMSSVMICGFDRVFLDLSNVRGGWNDVYFMLVSVAGMFYWCYVISHVTADVIMKTGERSRFQHKVQRVTSELRKHYLPGDLQVRVKKYYDILWRNSKSHNIGQSYNDADLSENLRCEIALLMHRKLLVSVPLFESCEDMCLSQILMALKTQLYLRGEVILHSGAPAHSMMIIAKGVVRVLGPDLRNVVAELRVGSFFGEMALIHKSRRSSTIYAATFADVKVLDAKDFKEIANEYPDFRELLEQIARDRTKTAQRNERLASGVVGMKPLVVEPKSPASPLVAEGKGGTGNTDDLRAEIRGLKDMVQLLSLQMSGGGGVTPADRPTPISTGDVSNDAAQPGNEGDTKPPPVDFHVSNSGIFPSAQIHPV